MFRDIIKRELEESISIKNKILSDTSVIQNIESGVKTCLECFRKGNKILTAGNGGSASESQHFAGELINKLYLDRNPLNAISLNTDTSVITAISNDYGYDNIFSRQIEGLGNKGDVFIGITTSGNSENIIYALKKAKEKELKTIVFNGNNGGIIEKENLSDINIIIPSTTPRVQEFHMVLTHIFCGIIEKEIFG